jgi:hypothetical protein
MHDALVLDEPQNPPLMPPLVRRTVGITFMA